MKIAREKETIITIMVGFLILSTVFPIPVLLLVTVGIGIAGIASDKLTHWIHRAWFMLADMLGYVMSKVILGTLFIVVLLPIALMAKIFRKDIMMIKKDYPSYFVEKHIVYEPKDLENPW
jgi:Saxitoxin biosynthesis operon protein SxtJ